MSQAAHSRRPERQAIARRTALRCGMSGNAAALDEVAVEEPLEIRVASDTLAVVMRTPGEDHYLATGFLFGEGIIRELADLGRLAHCGRPTDPGYGNLIDIAPGPGTVLAPELAGFSKRGTMVGSACGVCGRERIDDLLERLEPVASQARIGREEVARSVAQLQAGQSVFARTGGLHGALACDAGGVELAASEDVGRHNAVDKVIGKLLYAGQLGVRQACAERLVVSGRASFEIVQKAAAARIAILIAVSAPSSLAIDLAERLDITLIGFAREASFNVYTHPERIARS